MASGSRLGIDIGGTFTDVVLLGDNGSVRTKKVLSTPGDYAYGVVAGAVALLAECGVDPADRFKLNQDPRGVPLVKRCQIGQQRFGGHGGNQSECGHGQGQGWVSYEQWTGLWPSCAQARCPA